eukprot:Em0010g1004a
MSVKVHVLYCGEGGYASRYHQLERLLMSEFVGQITMTGETTPGTTGYFEVSVNNELVHSKKVVFVL